MKKYIIIGGGSAGIAAAYKILESSKTATVLLLEGSNIFGGRARTDTKSIPGLAFDKGCVYIQDPRNPLNPWPKIAAQLGFELEEENDKSRIRYQTAEGYKTVESVPAVTAIVTGLQTDYDQNKTSPNVTVTDVFPLIEQDEALGLASSPYGPFTESTEPWNYIAADRARESTEEWGNNLFVKEGLGTLVKTYGENLKKVYKERFNVTFKAVKEVAYNADTVTVTDISNNRYTADACIVTVPVSILAARNINFIPPLPDEYNMALQALKLGSYKKLAVQLSKMPEEIKDGVNYYLYNEQLQGVWQIFRLPFYPKNVLVVHTSGNFAAQLDEMADTEVFDLFQTSFREAYNNEPVFMNKYGMTNWSDDKLILGAYSFTRPIGNNPNDTTALNARKQMAKPILNKIFFAGEAYNLKAYGTLQGAYIDGQDAAENALRYTED